MGVHAERIVKPIVAADSIGEVLLFFGELFDLVSLDFTAAMAAQSGRVTSVAKHIFDHVDPSLCGLGLMGLWGI